MYEYLYIPTRNMLCIQIRKIRMMFAYNVSYWFAIYTYNASYRHKGGMYQTRDSRVKQ